MRSVRKLWLTFLLGAVLTVVILPVTSALAGSSAGEVVLFSGVEEPALPVDLSAAQITVSQVYSVYLPIIIGPPAPSSKKGFVTGGWPSCSDLQTLRASWYHNGSPFPDPTCSSDDGDKFVPMLYRPSSMENLSQAVINAQKSGWLIGFGEPNLTEQNSYLTPEDGAILWKQIETAVEGTDVKLVSPAPNQWEPGQNGQTYGNQWTWAMVEAYKDQNCHADRACKPRFDAIAWHYYTNSLPNLQTYLLARRSEALARGYDVPFWILEFAGNCVTSTTTEIQTYMNSAVPWFNQTSWIGRYAWFATRLTPASDSAGYDYTRCSLIDATTGQITGLGQTYWWH